MPTFPARPINGGKLSATNVDANCWYEPKVNGWRTMVHLPTLTMYNRHGDACSLTAEFENAMLELKHYLHPYDWVDCEGLERRHGLCRGVLIVLDLPVNILDYDMRREEMRSKLPLFPLNTKVTHGRKVFMLPRVPAKDAPVLWELLQSANDKLTEDNWATSGGKRIDFYEGLVAKHALSRYPIQTRSDSEEFPFWTKHRFIN